MVHKVAEIKMSIWGLFEFVRFYNVNLSLDHLVKIQYHCRHLGRARARQRPSTQHVSSFLLLLIISQENVLTEKGIKHFLNHGRCLSTHMTGGWWAGGPTDPQGPNSSLMLLFFLLSSLLDTQGGGGGGGNASSPSCRTGHLTGGSISTHKPSSVRHEGWLGRAEESKVGQRN